METIKRYPPYRFVILAIFMLITLVIEIQWLTHAAVARPAEVFYHGQFDPASFLNIDFLAIAQPFILNSVTAVTARWFPLSERDTAAGLLALAQYLGIIVAMLVTPALVGSKPDLANYGTGFEKML